ncbi:DEAD/DEAH box helicase [Methanolacinia paynteri]|uniref:DEAD/DEAH box helicase n=1 Tax=Methanolacinia paynteri TaxID=230356 RepID=UPI00064E1FE0|nr:DEAD/DEAH box helicase [Methanolacinia paynteri]
MRLVVNPQRGSYKIFFYDRNLVAGSGIVEIVRTGKGFRPKNYKYKPVEKRQYKNIPSKELISALRRSNIYMTVGDKNFESFLSDLQIPFKYLNACRTCLIEDRITPLKNKNSVRYGREKICLDCAKKELRRELGYLGGTGALSSAHLEKLLELYMDLNRVLGMVQPDRLDMSKTLFDRLEAHEIRKTSAIKDLPLPKRFKEHCGVENLMPVQQLSVEAGLLEGKDQLIVAATASGKTFIGEMAGVKNFLENRGNTLFLVPLVALANQKYSRFTKKYGFLDVSLKTGVSRLNIPETRVKANRSMDSAIIVGTYEGVDYMLRCGRTLGKIGTVVIDEVQNLEEPERGHRLDGLISRLKFVAPHAQFLYLSATIGFPHLLAEKLNSSLVEYMERPVPLERHLIFVNRGEKIKLIKRMVSTEYKTKSSKGFRGQTIVFTFSRSRCHDIADAIGEGKAAAYHAGLTAKERREVETKFEKGELSAVVTTAALAAGVDFPASQVIFDSLAMGIEWLTVQEFSQMMGRAGRPDFHDMGKVVVLAEPGASYSRDSKLTEEEVAINLLKGEMEEVSPVYNDEESSEELVANSVVCGGDIDNLERICASMVGEMIDILPVLKKRNFIKVSGNQVVMSPAARVMAEHFIGINTYDKILSLITVSDDPLEILAEIECDEPEKNQK